MAAPTSPPKFVEPSVDVGKEKEAAKKEQEASPLKQKNFLYKTYIDRIAGTIWPKWSDDVRKIIGKRKLVIDYTTGLWILIDRTGHVVKIILIESSHEKAFDDAAIAAFTGGYFPNPPKELIDSDGYGRILWGFKIYAN